MRFWETYSDKNDGAIRYFDLKRKTNKVGVILIYLISIIFAIIFLYPIIWVFMSALKTTVELRSSTSLLPQAIDWVGIRRSWKTARLDTAYFYSLIQCCGAIVCSIVFNGLAGYMLGILKPRGHMWLWRLLMGIMLIPGACNFIYLYKEFVTLGLNKGQMWPLFLGAGAAPYTILLFKVFFENIPRDYIEAARLDGATNFDIFLRIVVPLSKPIVVLTAINAFIGTWSDFLMPYLCLANTGHETVMVRLFQNTGGSASQMLQLRIALFSVLPPILVFAIFQKYISNNNANAGVKG